MENFYNYSVPETVRLLGRRFRDYRLRIGMTQREVAERSGLTVYTLSKFENGTARNISLGTFLLLLRAIGAVDNIDAVLPDLPESAYLRRDDDTRIQRVRHRKP